NHAGHVQPGVPLKIRQCFPRNRPKGSVEGPSIITQLLERALYIQDNLVREKVTIGIDRAVVVVVVINWIITPGWIPVPCIAIVVPGSDENDGPEMPIPPIPIMPCVPVSLQRFRVTDLVDDLDLCGGRQRSIIRRGAINRLRVGRRVDASGLDFLLW